VACKVGLFPRAMGGQQLIFLLIAQLFVNPSPQLSIASSVGLD